MNRHIYHEPTFFRVFWNSKTRGLIGFSELSLRTGEQMQFSLSFFCIFFLSSTILLDFAFFFVQVAFSKRTKKPRRTGFQVPTSTRINDDDNTGDTGQNDHASRIQQGHSGTEHAKRKPVAFEFKKKQLHVRWSFLPLSFYPFEMVTTLFLGDGIEQDLSVFQAIWSKRSILFFSGTSVNLKSDFI